MGNIGTERVAKGGDLLSQASAAELLVVIVCYRAVDLTIDCLRSIAPQVAELSGVHVAVCENGTGPDAARQLAEAIATNGWEEWVSLVPIDANRGFAGGNNVILRAAVALEQPPAFLLLLNADTIVRAGALATLLAAARENPGAGIISPRLEWPDGRPQESCFRDFSPLHEFLAAARTGVLSRLAGMQRLAERVSDTPVHAEWTSFACALIRREVLDSVGVLDEGFYLYFDDSDYCRRARRAGWTVLYWPGARVVHLRGRSNPVKSLTAGRRRRPRYWYESRARYYAKFYGRLGLWSANGLWWMGRSISLMREVIGSKAPHICEREWLDIWTNWREPLART